MRSIRCQFNPSVFFVLLFLILQNAHAQSDQLRFTNFTVAEGLSQNSGIDILQDSNGYLWVGTQIGLNRYNGYSFTEFRHIPNDSTSLNSEYIRSLYEDKEKRIWVGTENGLHVYNANEQNFRRFDISALLIESGTDSTEVSNDILAIAQASSSQYWIGTAKGLVYLDIENDQARIVEYGEGIVPVYELMVDRNGDLWIGDNSGYVVRRKLSIDTESPAEKNQLILKSGVLIRALHEDSNGDIWIGTEGEGLYKYKFSGNKRIEDELATPVSIELRSDSITTIHSDSEGRLWIGYFEKGISLIDNKNNIKHFYHDASNSYSLINDEVKDICVDQTGVVWIGTWDGVSRVSSYFGAFKLYISSDKEGGLHDDRVVAFEEENPDTYWLGTLGGGLFYFDRSEETFVKFTANGFNGRLCGDVIFDLDIDSNSNLWVAALLDGVCTLDLNISDINERRRGFKSYRDFYSDNGESRRNNVVSVLSGRDSLYWFGSRYEGLHVLDLKNNSSTFLTDSSHVNRLLANHIWPLIEDERGNVWGGASGGGLFYFDYSTQQLTNYPLDDGNEISNSIYDLYLDSHNALWAATDDGAKQVDLATMEVKTYRVEDGLPNNSARGLVEDDFGNMWITTNNGLSRFSPADSTFKNFFIEDGLQGNRFYARSVMKASNGKLFFGGDGGFNIVDPALIQPDTLAPTIVLDEILVNNNKYEEGPAPYLRDNLVLEHYENKFSLSFTSLNFTNVSQNKYKYRLTKTSNKWNPFKPVNVDTSWTDLDTENEVTFPLQGYGEYTFEVLGTNSDGVWGTQGLDLPIIIKTPWYAKIWFRGLIGLSILGIIVGGLLLRMRGERREAALKLETERQEAEFLLETERKESEFRLKAERMQSDYQLGIERLRLKIAQGLHDDVGASLATIAMQLSMMKSRLQVTEKEKERIRKLGAMVRETGQVVRDTEWVINTKHDSLLNLVNQMREQALLMLDDDDREHTFNQAPSPMPELQLDMDFKQNVYFLFKEALNNANKYSEATRFLINVSYEHDILTVQVEDNGKGFDKENVKEGSGLGNMKDRAAEMGGSYDIQSTPGKGTVVTLKAPVVEYKIPDVTTLSA